MYYHTCCVFISFRDFLKLTDILYIFTLSHTFFKHCHERTVNSLQIVLPLNIYLFLEHTESCNVSITYQAIQLSERFELEIITWF
jgi:hypothetical protein